MTRKRIIIITISIIACLLAVVLILINIQPTPLRPEQLIPTLPGPTPAPLTASLHEMIGSVTARLAGQSQYTPVTPGMILNVSSAVKTGEKSKVRLDLSNQSILRLGENTLFVFQGEVKANDGYHYLINLGIGELWIILRDGQLQVETPSGLAAVRGSFLHVAYFPQDKSTQITCLEGRCNLKNASGQVDLVAGETAIVYNSVVPPATGRMQSHDVTEWLVNNPEATLVMPQLQATSAALPVETPGGSSTPPPTQAPTELALFEATLAATYETPVLLTVMPSGTPMQITPSQAPSTLPTLVPTLASTSTSQPTATRAIVFWTAVPPTSTQQPPPPAPTTIPTIGPTATAIPVLGCVGVTEIPISECNALVALYNSTNGASWTNKTGWLSTITPCSWYGIFCSGGHVSQLGLYPNGLVGSIPPEIGNLTYLTQLNLRSNQLSGNIPSQIGNLTKLTYLNLIVNQLNGAIPSQIGNLTNLQDLELSNNQLSGNIPPEIGGLTQLTYLDLGANQLSGNIPPEIGNLTHLTNLYIRYTQISGSIPSQIGNIKTLYYLDLDGNQLSGSIPPEIGNLSNLGALYLYNNQISGNIPPEIGALLNLLGLELQNNKLVGSIPLEIGNLTKLTDINFGNNQLTGLIPTEIGSLTLLSNLWLGGNIALTGPLPSTMTNIKSLYVLDYSNTGICNPTTDLLLQTMLSKITILYSSGINCP